MSDDLLNTGFDPNRRELCPDGACIGIIGSDGLCKECGAPSPSGPPKGEPTGEPAEEPAEAASAPEPTPEPQDRPAAESAGFDPNHRQLCPDGACIGLIGPDGKCKECGRRAE